MPNTDDLDVMNQKIVDVLTAAAEGLGLQNVFYGDQALIPTYPSVAVEPAMMSRDLDGTHRTLNTFTIYVMVYHGRVDDVQLTAKQCLQYSKAITDELHTDLQMGSLVAWGHVTAVEPGFAERTKVLLRSTRLTWTGISKTNL